MSRYRRLREDDEDRVILPRFANQEGDVNLLRMARDVESRKQAKAEERRRAEQRAFYRKKYANIFDGIENFDDADGKLDFLFNNLVPSSGKADTKAGEMVRAMMRIMYRDWNDEDIFYAGYGKETAGPAAEYLYQNTNEVIQNDIDNIVSDDLVDSAYTNALNDMAEDLIAFLRQNPELLATPNEDDIFNYKPRNILDNLNHHTFDCDFWDFTYNLLDRYNRDAVDEIESWLDDFVDQHTENGEVYAWARDAYQIDNLDILELEEVEREWDSFARALDDYLESEYDIDEDDEDEEDED